MIADALDGLGCPAVLREWARHGYNPAMQNYYPEAQGFVTDAYSSAKSPA